MWRKRGPGIRGRGSDEPDVLRLQKLIGWVAQNLADAALPGNEVLRAIVVRFMAVRAFKGADVRVGDERIRALAGHTLAPQYGKALQTGFTFYEPDQSHL
jgi:hypothetical protein